MMTSRPTMRHWQRVAVLALALLLGGMLPMAAPPHASAHALLVTSDPPLGAALDSSPERLKLTFNEGLDPSFTRIQLLDGQGQIVNAGPGSISPDDPTVIMLDIDPLPNGTYSIVWRALSVVDGHVTLGNVGFSVGAGSPRASILPPPLTPPPATALPSLADALARWAGYLFTVLIGGSLAFGLLVWQPAYVGISDGTAADEAASRLLRRLAWIGLGGLVVATIAFAIVRAAIAANTGILEAIGPPLGVWMQTRAGLLIGMRLLWAGVLAVLVGRLRSAGRGDSMPWIIALSLVGVIVLTFSLMSHGASSGSALAVAADWVHLAAVAAWMGGLVPLAILLTTVLRNEQFPDRPELAKLIPRFTRVALMCIAALAVTGLYAALIHVRTLDALEVTTYGRAVIFKVGVFLILFALGAINLRLISPRLPERASWLRRTTRVEVVLGLLILGAAAVLTGSSPAFDALDAQTREGYVEDLTQDGVRMIFRVAPAQLGDNEFAVDVDDHRPGADQTPAEVVMQFGLANGELGITEVPATSEDGIRYTVRGSYLTVSGEWQVAVIVRRSRFTSIRHNYLITLGSQPALGSAADEPPGMPANPIQPDAASVARGEALYQTNCVPCHGVGGKGDGPVGVSLNPRPADLTAHTVPGVHSDGQLWLWISDGYPDSQMPAFREPLTDNERWDIVNYIRTLGQEP